MVVVKKGGVGVGAGGGVYVFGGDEGVVAVVGVRVVVLWRRV